MFHLPQFDPVIASMLTFVLVALMPQAASTPESANDHKRNQLRELASLNGTLRDDENQPCQNCGKIGHRCASLIF